MPVARLGVSIIGFLYFVKAVEAINLDSIKTKNIMGGIMILLAKVNIMLYRLISSIFNMNAIG